MFSLLSIAVEQLPEGGLPVRGPLSPGELDLADELFAFRTPVEVDVVFRCVVREVIASGQLRTEVESSCVRCLTPVTMPLEIAIHEVWLHRSPRDEAERLFSEEDSIAHDYDGRVVEAAEAFREALMAALPECVYCREDCRGLCPRCGVNLNRETCRCAPVASDDTLPNEPEWKRKLKSLKPDR